ncbi:MAG: substrate-binding domain-containing protein, partial [Candidatus Eremiobacteraeota bacterium]|nr:substrate-binding domain-containing protein [Candidatus Eremiobacteraeota bacterium]
KKTSLLALLRDPAVKIGRTDPALDPKGSRTLRVLDLIARHYRHRGTAEDIAAREGVFPEEDLLVRVETGELDGGFFYSTETTGKRLRVLELPADANLSKDIVYGAAILREAPNPAAARAFLAFILRGEGRRILERAGLRYFSVPRVVH